MRARFDEDIRFATSSSNISTVVKPIAALSQSTALSIVVVVWWEISKKVLTVEGKKGKSSRYETVY